MSTRGRTVLIVVLILLGIGEFCWAINDTMSRFVASPIGKVRFAGQDARSAHALPVHLERKFTMDEVHAFLAKARDAESIADPLQRCLGYPDPPRSHWSPATIEAYCRYYLQKTVSFREAQELIQSGHAAELDRRLAQDLQAQLTRPESHGLLDHTYFSAFDDGSFNVRQTLDAWKRASPNSAFAYAASGSAYVWMAARARGGAYINDTPQSNIDAMNRLLGQADTDLQRAMALNPQITPTYVAMIKAGSMSLGAAYVDRAARRGLAAAPDNYAIYGMLSGAMEPRWGGSLALMDRVARQAQAHVKENPLLAILLSAEPAYRYDVCNCQSSASENGHPELAAIYLSEVLRFQSGAQGVRRRRDTSLAGVGESLMALDDANRLIAANPGNPRNYLLRGDIYMSLMDDRNAEKDLERALAMDPDDIDVLAPLGNLYTNQTHEWDKAWDIADRIIRKYPGSPGGWVMRATIQETQPRAGLGDTYQYFVSHFAKDPSMRWQIAHMREILAKASPNAPVRKSD